MGEPATGEPARGYRWPPFQPGHTAALRHGADSERTFGPVAERLADELVVTAPWCARPAFAASVRAWARAEAKVELVGQYLDVHGLLDDGGEPRPAASYLLRLEARADNARARLGLDPTSFAGLLAKLSDNPQAAGEREALLAEARALVDARDARALAAAQPDPEMTTEATP